jgi:hypothetical protein
MNPKAERRQPLSPAIQLDAILRIGTPKPAFGSLKLKGHLRF